MKIKVFENAEELKWFLHTKLVKECDYSAEFYMNRVVEEKDVNAFLERMKLPYRVKEL